MIQFETIDGPLYQWDTGRRIRIVSTEGEVCSTVHYSNGMVAACDGNTVAIPNILLQTAKAFTVYGVVVSREGVRTLCAYTFSVSKKEKPEGYIYTETEVQTWEAFNQRLKYLEGEGLADAVASYLEEYPPEAGATAEEAAQIKANKSDINALKEDTAALSQQMQTQAGQIKDLQDTAVSYAHVHALIDAKLGVIENGTY